MITVLAGVNGAGKSSIGGSAIRAQGADWYNPDEMARIMRTRFPGLGRKDVNSAVWQEGVKRLDASIRQDTHFIFETTLGGRTIVARLHDAIAAGRVVKVWYCGLDCVDLHIERVAARVALGGHDIPETLIRSRYHTSMRNLCHLAPGLNELGVYDNSRPLDQAGRPNIRRVLHMTDGSNLEMALDMPGWAKPIASTCLNLAS